MEIDYIFFSYRIWVELLFYLLFSLLRIANAESVLDQRWLGRALVIAIGRIAAIARFHFIRLTHVNRMTDAALSLPLYR